MPTLELDFFGIETRIVLPTELDVEHFGYYFGDFATTLVGAPDLELQFTTRPHGSFVKSLTDPQVTKVTMAREGSSSWRIHDVFTARSTAPSPLPPFDLPSFRGRFFVVHAASVVHPRTGAALLLCGPSFSGKSVLTLELLRRGWGFLSDDLSVIERSTGLALAFPRPLGIREHTRRMLPWLQESLSQADLTRARRIRTASGETLMLRADEVFPGTNRRYAPFTHVVLLEQHDDATVPTWSGASYEALDARILDGMGRRAPHLDVVRVRYQLWPHLEALVDQLEARMANAPCLRT